MRTLIVIVCVVLVLAALQRLYGSLTCTEPILVVRQWEEDTLPTGRSLTVVTLNLAEERSLERIFEDLAHVQPLKQADVLLLQEAVHSEEAESTAARLAERLRLHLAFASGAPPKGQHYEGLAILSRMPLRDVQVLELPRFGLHLRSRCRIALTSVVDGPAGPVQVISLHLDTRINSQRRLEQLAPVLEAAEAFEGPVILGGDFNTNPFWWVEHLVPVPFVADQAAVVVDKLRRMQFNTPFENTGATNDHLGLQLDWIFLRGLRAEKWGVEQIGFSDHHAVWVRLADN